MRISRSVFSLSLCLLLLLAARSMAQETNFAAGPQYLITSGSPQFAQPIATPSLDLNAPLPPLPPAFEHGVPSTHASYTINPASQSEVGLYPIFYGTPRTSVVEISYALPAVHVAGGSRLIAFLDTGVSEITDVETLHTRGYGISLGEYARYWKAHTRPATRRYTNEDIERLHQRG